MLCVLGEWRIKKNWIWMKLINSMVNSMPQAFVKKVIWQITLLIKVSKKIPCKWLNRPPLQQPGQLRPRFLFVQLHPCKPTEQSLYCSLSQQQSEKVKIIWISPDVWNLITFLGSESYLGTEREREREREREGERER